MEIKNVTISTETRYRPLDNNDDDPRFGNTQQDCLVIKVPLPGGKAEYEIPISLEFRKSLEKAVQLK